MSARNFTSEMTTVATSIAIFSTSTFQLRLQPSPPILRSIISTLNKGQSPWIKYQPFHHLG
ncbi:hypothetical protein ZOSMA_72G00310 [Zostera marina]|uniref:Uncharacterized protein n=1 Tax=Zostera marina TaxID=29655 RepID=A0A0K9NQ03_ZOSMR|nr:hypothetical protein ZOSMA_72G00310 [Zostera marina]